MRTILITNDDGIYDDGLKRLAEAAVHFGEVFVVAPDGQRSAASHSITLRTHIDLFPCDIGVPEVHAFSCSGSPADCVRVGILHVMPERPDVVLSGINDGYNAASDIQYSATCGAAFEAAFQGIPAVALSEGAGGCHELTDAYLLKVLEELIDVKSEPGTIMNVNFPNCPLNECRGILRDRKVSAGMFYRDTYEVKEQLPGGGERLAVVGEYNEDAEPGTDFRAVTEHFISIGKVNNIGY